MVATDDNGTINHVHTDHLGGTNITTDATGAITQTLDYYPFGDTRIDTGTNDETKQFTGYIKDSSTGLSYAGQRYYAGNIGRFISQDPVALFDPNQVLADPQQLNTYSYVANNPVKYVDPNGELRVEAFLLRKVADSYIRNSSHIPSEVREANFAINNPIAAVRIGPIDNRYPGGLSNTSSNFAVNLTKEGYAPKQGKEGTERNALRHTIWQGIISNQLGESTAMKAGNAHENNPFINTNQVFDTLSQADVAVDLLNNQIGRNLVSNHSNLTNVQIAEMAVDQFYNDGLYTAQQGEGGWHAVKSKITTEQYKASKSEVNRLSRTGLRKKKND